VVSQPTIKMEQIVIKNIIFFMSIKSLLEKF